MILLSEQKGDTYAVCGGSKYEVERKMHMFNKVKVYEGSNNVVLEDIEYGYDEVTLKWDGCVHYLMGSNGVKPSEDATGENTDYFHICDIDEMIAKLQALKEYGKKHFNNEYWN